MFIKAKEEKDDEKLKPIVQNFVEKVIVHEEDIEVTLKITLGGPLVTDGGGEGYWTVTKFVKYPAKGYSMHSVVNNQWLHHPLDDSVF